MKTIMAILVAVLCCGSASPGLAEFIPQEIIYSISNHYPDNPATISFAGGSSPLVGKDLFVGWTESWYNSAIDPSRDDFHFYSLGYSAWLSFETGPHFGVGYDFQGGGHIKMLSGTDVLLDGVFDDAHIEAGVLKADLDCKILKPPTFANTWLGPDFVYRGTMEIAFTGAGTDSDPFTSTGFRYHYFPSGSMEPQFGFIDVAPLPGSILFLGSGLIGLAGLGWRKMRG